MKKHNTNALKWLHATKWPLDLDLEVLLKPIKLLDKYERWRRVAKILKISKKAELRLEWIIYYYEGHNVSEVARHFGIRRKTFYKWFCEFEPDNLYSLYKLEDKSRAPKHVRQRELRIYY